MQIRYCTYTDTGDRPVNEDRLCACRTPAGCCFAVADGLGGLDLGDEAAELACRAVAYYAAILPAFSSRALEQMFFAAQQAILERQHALHCESQMKTTLNVVLVGPQAIHWAHVGDSRTYYARGQRLVRRTFDHSVTQMLSAIGQVKEGDIRFHEDRSKLLRVLGAPWARSQVEVEADLPLCPPQQLLLCSDGFWELITEKEMGAQLRRAASPEEWLAQMAGIVEERGRGREMDNYSAIAVLL